MQVALEVQAAIVDVDISIVRFGGGEVQWTRGVRTFQKSSTKRWHRPETSGEVFVLSGCLTITSHHISTVNGGAHPCAVHSSPIPHAVVPALCKARFAPYSGWGLFKEPVPYIRPNVITLRDLCPLLQARSNKGCHFCEGFFSQAQQRTVLTRSYRYQYCAWN